MRNIDHIDASEYQVPSTVEFIMIMFRWWVRGFLFTFLTVGLVFLISSLT